MLEGPLAHAGALDPDGQASSVHHGEHRADAAVLAAQQFPGRFVERHRTRRAAVYAELALQPLAAQRVSIAEFPVGVDAEFWHQEERQPPSAGGGIRRTGEDQVDYVLGEIVLAPRDEDLASGDSPASVVGWRRPRPYLAEVRTGLG